MNIEIFDYDSQKIVTRFDLPNNPFVKDEIINIVITNKDKNVWNIEDSKQSFKVIDIQHYLRQTYYPNSSISSVFTIIVTVKDATNKVNFHLQKINH